MVPDRLDWFMIKIIISPDSESMFQIITVHENWGRGLIDWLTIIFFVTFLWFIFIFLNFNILLTLVVNIFSLLIITILSFLIFTNFVFLNHTNLSEYAASWNLKSNTYTGALSYGCFKYVILNFRIYIICIKLKLSWSSLVGR